MLHLRQYCTNCLAARYCALFGVAETVNLALHGFIIFLDRDTNEKQKTWQLGGPFLMRERPCGNQGHKSLTRSKAIGTLKAGASSNPAPPLRTGSFTSRAAFPHARQTAFQNLSGSMDLQRTRAGNPRQRGISLRSRASAPVQKTGDHSRLEQELQP